MQSSSLKRLRPIILAALLAALPLAVLAAAPPAKDAASGVYDILPRTDHGQPLAHRKLYLAFDGDAVTGYFDNPYPQPEEADVDDTCRFVLTGNKAAQGRLELSAQYPGDDYSSSIVLTPRPDGAWSVTVKGIVDHPDYLPNCSNPSLVSGDLIKLAAAHPWRIIGYIDKPKATLYSEPSMDKATKGYLVKLDPVALQVMQGEWSQVDYLGKDHELVRWIRTMDMYYYLER